MSIFNSSQFIADLWLKHLDLINCQGFVVKRWLWLRIIVGCFVIAVKNLSNAFFVAELVVAFATGRTLTKELNLFLSF
jgi:hypothetical protein